MTQCSIIITTTNKEERALILAKEIVKLNLARCVQIEKVLSIYEWEGKIEQEEEYRLSIKAVDHNMAKIKRIIGELHNYNLPEIIILPITGGSEKYLAWLKA